MSATAPDLTVADLLAAYEKMGAAERKAFRATVREMFFADLAAADQPLWMYVIQSGDHGPVKVGISCDPRRRLGELQRSNPERLHLRLTWRAHPVEERLFHEEYACFRLQGEWFEPHWSLLEEARLYAADRKELG